MTDARIAGLDLDAVRSDFPILASQVHGKPLVYLDNAASSQRPSRVIEATDRFYRTRNANVHRGVHALSVAATDDYEASREKLRVFLNAEALGEVIFTKGCTEAINLVAYSLDLGPGDVVLVSQMEHHSNIVPWQLTGAAVKPIKITDQGEIDLDSYRQLLSEGGVKVVSVVHVSNSLGTVNPIREMADLAHAHGAVFVSDGAQAAPHQLVDVRALGVDFYTVSGHKMYGPTGIGVLCGKRELLEKMRPYQGGGDMIRTVSFERTTFAELPAKFEAGTPNIAGSIGLGAAVDYLSSLGTGGDLRAGLETAFEAIHRHESELLEHAESEFRRLGGIRITGTAPEKASVLGFTIEGVHPHDVGTLLDAEGVAIRTGHHCCQPLMKRLGVPATARASFAFYNTHQEVETLVKAVRKVKEMFA